MAVNDRIERSIMVEVTPEKVWAALTTEDGMKGWFGDIAEIDLKPGGEAVFGWSDYGSSSEAVIEVVEPHTRFAFRWAAGENTSVEDGPSSLVEFLIESDETGTRITIVETGFASFPDDTGEYHFQENSKGWKSEMDDLAAYLETAA